MKKYGVVSLKHMNEKGTIKIVEIFVKMRYEVNKDFRINHFGGDNRAEIVIMNKRLKKDIKLLGTLKIKEIE